MAHCCLDVPSAVLQVVQQSTSTLLLLPKSDVYNTIPDKKKRLVLCEPFYSPEGCKAGKNCKFIHASLHRADRTDIHMNRAWRSREECPYRLLAPGHTLSIKSARGKDTHSVDSGLVAQTRCVFFDPDRPPSHCSHFYHGYACYMGSECDFAHVIYADPHVVGDRIPKRLPRNQTAALSPKTDEGAQGKKKKKCAELSSPCLREVQERQHMREESMDQLSEGTEPHDLNENPVNIIRCGENGRWRYDPYMSASSSATSTPKLSFDVAPPPAHHKKVEIWRAHDYLAR